MKKKLRSFVFPALLIPAFFAFLSCSSATGSDSSGEAPRYRVIYSGNGNTGGTAPVDANSYAKGDSATVAQKPDAMVKAGYYFSSWNTSADATGVSYAPGATCVMGDSSLTLYAIWGTYSWTVTFDGQDATTQANPSSCVVSYPATHVTSLPTAPVKTGYVFGGWWTGKGGTGTEFTASTAVSANVTVYAKWTAVNDAPDTPTIPLKDVSYTVAFSADDGLTTYSSSSVAAGTALASLPTAPTKTGYAFGGWWTGKGGTGTEFTASTVVSADVTVYAKWTAIDNPPSTPDNGAKTVSATVSIPADGSITFSPSSLTVQTGQTLKVSVQEKYAKYVWYIDGDKGSYPSSQSITINASIYFVGVHELTLAVTDSAGTVSSGSCRFTVTN
jgi:uncharacterized repeat protein (TIGR02543 family)